MYYSISDVSGAASFRSSVGQSAIISVDSTSGDGGPEFKPRRKYTHDSDRGHACSFVCFVGSTTSALVSATATTTSLLKRQKHAFDTTTCRQDHVVGWRSLSSQTS